jgi:hypothetical protein
MFQVLYLEKKTGAIFTPITAILRAVLYGSVTIAKSCFTELSSLTLITFHEVQALQ